MEKSEENTLFSPSKGRTFFTIMHCKENSCLKVGHIISYFDPEKVYWKDLKCWYCLSENTGHTTVLFNENNDILQNFRKKTGLF